ncbi:hypothetical protein [Absidia glauca]|uniref:Uncharacterized protein n=1 Tax=Absidia glauca TaxID=4829 RepID=A0A163MW87_ABSGL|nr:hypothetical protein [Absidia glauca]
MSHSSSRLTSSPPKSAFQWPAPLSPRGGLDTPAANTDTPLKEILDKYQDDEDTLRHILKAKVEEDKKLAARDMLKTEQARIHLKQLDLEYLREQCRLSGHYDKHPQGPPPPTFTVTPLPPPSANTTTSSMVAAAGTPTSHPHSLAPVQQQALARLTGTHSDTYHQQSSPSSSHPYEYPPSSPIAYPHSAHPLCPPPDLRNNPPSSKATGRYNSHYASSMRLGPLTSHDKRTHHSVSDDDKLSHNKVMKALKAKIQRGYRPETKRQRGPIILEGTSSGSSSATSPSTTHTPSPTAKPILPPIDTTVGRPPSPSDPLLPPRTASTSAAIKLESDAAVH